jgi:zinc transport system substrate-binding protein
MRYMITLLLASGPAFAEVPSVVTDIPPVHSLVSQVMGDLGQPVLLLSKGADEHDFQLRPSQAAAVANSDLVIWIGPELTPWLDSAKENRPEGAPSLALLDAEGTRTRSYDAAQDDKHDHAEADHDEHDEHGDHEEHGHSHDGTDPHAWLDPDNARIWLGLIADRLSSLDPDNAATYQTNATAAGLEIGRLDAEVTAILAPVQGKPLVTFHDAYGYFADHFGLTFAGSIALGDASSPGAKRLGDLRATMQAGNVLCIFPEVQHDPALVSQMAEGTGARIGGAIDPVGASLEPGPGAYAALLTGIATTLAACVSG